MQSRIILHVDLNYFFAQIEENRNSEIKGKPVVVCVYSGRTKDSGAVSSCNYLARELGVKAGMPIVFAKKVLKNNPDAVFLPTDHEYYEKVSERVMNIFKKYAVNFESGGIDEVYVEVTGKIKNFGDAKKLAEKIKKELKEKENLICSIGIGPNKLVAKIASDFQKPNGLTVVEEKEVKKFLVPLKVNKILGIGKKTEERMNEMGIETIEDLAKTSEKKLIEEFGPKLGKYFHDAANGIDDEPVQERERDQISRIGTLKEDSLDFNFISKEIDELTKHVHKQVVEEKLKFKSIGILAFMENLETKSRTHTLSDYSNSLDDIKKVVKELLKKFLEEEQVLKIRRIGVKVSNFEGRKEIKSKTLSQFIKK